MRDMESESKWFNHPVIGYVPLDEDGTPYRVSKFRYGREEKQPPRIYKTLAMAANQSPTKTATEVRMFKTKEIT